MESDFAVARAVWDVVSSDVQAEIDDEVVHGRTLRAIVALRDRGGIAPAPDLLLGRAVLTYRRDVLIGEGRIVLAPDPTVEQVLAAVEEPPVAIEAGWGGDSVLLCAIVARDGAEFDERSIGKVQRRPSQRSEAARVAVAVGREVADGLGLPFHFAHIGQPRWWDTQR